MYVTSESAKARNIIDDEVRDTPLCVCVISSQCKICSLYIAPIALSDYVDINTLMCIYTYTSL